MKHTNEQVQALTFHQRVCAAVDHALDDLKPQALARSAAARIQPGERRAHNQYNTDDFNHQGNKRRSAAEAALHYQVSTTSVVQMIMVRRKDSALFEQVRTGACTVYAAYRKVSSAKRDVLTAQRVRGTIEALRLFVGMEWKDTLGRRRAPGRRSIRQEGGDARLFNTLWHPMLKAYDKGGQTGLDAALETAVAIL